MEKLIIRRDNTIKALCNADKTIKAFCNADKMFPFQKHFLDHQEDI